MCYEIIEHQILLTLYHFHIQIVNSVLFKVVLAKISE